MALSKVYTAVAGHTITADRWNTEFDNIYGNGTDVGFPLTKAVSFAGYTITWDAAGATTITSSASQAFQITPGAKTGTPSTTGGLLNFVASTYTDNNTAGSGTATAWAGWAIQRPTLAATNSSVTTTDAASLYIANSPAEGTNDTITNEWAQWVDAGAVRFDGNLWVQGELVASSNPWRFTATVSSKALTITLQDVNGNTPTASSPVPIVFRNATLTTPALATVLATAATTVVVPSGGTLGFAAAQASRIYVVALNNAGTAELAVWHSLSTQSLKGINEGILHTSTTIGTGSDSAHVLYSTTGRSNVAVRVLGYIDIATGAVAGEWDNEDTVIQMMGLGVPRTGDLIQSIRGTYTAAATTTSTFPFDDTPPLIAEGAQISANLDLAITPTALANLLLSRARISFGDAATADCVVVGLFQDATSECLAAWSHNSDAANATSQIVGTHQFQAATTSSTTLALRIGGQGTTITFNGVSGGRKWGGAWYSEHIVEEICL